MNFCTGLKIEWSWQRCIIGSRLSRRKLIHVKYSSKIKDRTTRDHISSKKWTPVSYNWSHSVKAARRSYRRRYLTSQFGHVLKENFNWPAAGFNLQGRVDFTSPHYRVFTKSWDKFLCAATRQCASPNSCFLVHVKNEAWSTCSPARKCFLSSYKQNGRLKRQSTNRADWHN